MHKRATQLFGALGRLCTGIALSAVMLTGCPEDTGPAPTSGSDGGLGDTTGGDASVVELPGDAGPQTQLTASVYERLLPSCGGCHGDGTSKPYFASFESFENLLVADTQFIVPGDPEGSELVELLKGTGTRTFLQMPPDGLTFEELSDAGQTQISVPEVEDWIRELDGYTPGGSEDAPTDVVLVRRLRAEQIYRSFRALLGLEDEVFWDSAQHHGYYPVIGWGSAGNYPMYSPDWPPGWSTNSPIRAAATLRWYALGGPNWAEGRKRDQSLSPTFMHTLTQVSQAYCRLSITDDTNDAVMHLATLSDGSADAAGSIRTNIAHLHLKFLGEPANDARVDDLFELFQTYETDSSREAAWVAVCSTLLRDPLFVTY